MTAGEFCNREVIVVGPHESIREAIGLMRRHHVGDVVVVEERDAQRYPVGILTDRDVVIEILAQEVDADALVVGDVMSPELLSVGEQDDLFGTIKKMREAGVRRVPVVSATGALVGILTVDDLMDVFAEYLGDLVALVRREQQRERTRRR